MKKNLSLSVFSVGPGCDVVDAGEEGEFCRSYGISEAGAVLVRPDGYVGWRKKGSSDNPIAELTEAYERLLSKK
jgi:hypothetical protein